MKPEQKVPFDVAWREHKVKRKDEQQKKLVVLSKPINKIPYVIEYDRNDNYGRKNNSNGNGRGRKTGEDFEPLPLPWHSRVPEDSSITNEVIENASNASNASTSSYNDKYHSTKNNSIRHVSPNNYYGKRSYSFSSDDVEYRGIPNYHRPTHHQQQPTEYFSITTHHWQKQQQYQQHYNYEGSRRASVISQCLDDDDKMQPMKHCYYYMNKRRKLGGDVEHNNNNTTTIESCFRMISCMEQTEQTRKQILARLHNAKNNDDVEGYNTLYEKTNPKSFLNTQETTDELFVLFLSMQY